MKFNELLQLLESDLKKEYSLFLDGYLPLSPTIMKRIKRTYITSWHSTNFKNIKNTIKMQGKNNSLSTTTDITVDIILGIVTDGGYILELTGNNVFTSASDSWTVRDRNGMRWLDFDARSGDDTYYLDEVHAMIQHNIRQISNKLFKDITVYTTYERRLNIIENSSGKEKQMFIKECFDYIEKFIKTELDLIKLGQEYTGTEYNEVVLSNFKIDSITLFNEGDMDLLENNIIQLKKLWNGDIYILDLTKCTSISTSDFIKKRILSEI